MNSAVPLGACQESTKETRSGCGKREGFSFSYVFFLFCNS